MLWHLGALIVAEFTQSSPSVQRMLPGRAQPVFTLPCLTLEKPYAFGFWPPTILTPNANRDILTKAQSRPGRTTKCALLASVQATSFPAVDLNALGIGSCAWAEPILHGSALAFLTLGTLFRGCLRILQSTSKVCLEHQFSQESDFLRRPSLQVLSLGLVPILSYTLLPGLSIRKYT